MVGAYQRARRNEAKIALSLLELWGIAEPTEGQFIGAGAIAEFMVTVTTALKGR